MTLGTVVVEANLTSGALITANFATEYGRQVFAVPGRIDSPSEQGLPRADQERRQALRRRRGHPERVRILFPASNRPPGASETGVLPAVALSENEQKVYDTLDHEEITIDDVIRKSGLPSSAVSVSLLSLEMKRLIRQLPGKLFVRNQ